MFLVITKLLNTLKEKLDKLNTEPKVTYGPFYNLLTLSFLVCVFILKYGGVHSASARGHCSEEALQGLSVPG